METKSGILQSKFVRILLVVVAAAAGIVGIISNNAGDIAEYAGEKQLAKLQEMIGPNAEIVIAPGTYNREIRILDGERGLFLALDGTYKITDTQGEVLADTGCTHISEKLDDRFWIMAEEAGGIYCLVDMEQVLTEGSFSFPELPEDCEYTTVHQSGKYYMANSPAGKQVYSIPDNELIHTFSEETLKGEFGPRFTSREGYVTYTRADGTDCVMNFYTGDIEYVCAEHENLVMDAEIGTLTAVRKPFFAKGNYGTTNRSFIYFLDENYEVALDGKLFNVGMSQPSYEYRIGHLTQTADYYNVESKMSVPGFVPERVTAILNKQGEFIYKEGECHGGYVRTILDDVLVVSDDHEAHMDYIELLTGEVLMENQELLCFRDFEDGIAAAEALPKGFKEGDYDDREIQVPHLERLYSEGRCGFVDENMQPLTDFVFDSVTATDNGYAVVYVDDMPVVIRFKGAV